MVDLVPPLRSVSDFDSVFNQYHDSSLPGDALSYCFIYRETHCLTRANRPPTDSLVHLLLNGYLRQWATMVRFLGSTTDTFGEDRFHQPLLRVLTDKWSLIHRLRTRNGLEGPIPADVGSIFDELYDTLRSRTKDGTVRRSSVVAGKLLHVLVPNLCIVWDREHVLDRGLETSNGERLGLAGDGESYVKYLEEKFGQVRRVADDREIKPKDFAVQVERKHVACLRRLFPTVSMLLEEPLTKILDEANYRTATPSSQ